MEGSPLGLTECGSENDVESLASPGYGQYPALVKTPVCQDWEYTNAWDASTLAEVVEPSPGDHGSNNALEWSQYPLELDPSIDPDAHLGPSKHTPQRINMSSSMAAESHTTPATFFPGPANFTFDGVPAQGS